jgi:hypothetical protein
MATFGEKAVGLDFNPSGDATVRRIKELYAQIIDICHTAHEALKGHPDGAEQARHYSTAITDAETAQMRAVKAITWKT